MRALFHALTTVRVFQEERGDPCWITISWIKVLSVYHAHDTQQLKGGGALVSNTTLRYKVLESLPDPGQMPAGVTMRVGSWSPMDSKVQSNSLTSTPMGEGRGPGLL